VTAVPARSALLYDTAASLRLVDTELRALDVPPAAGDAAPAAAAPAHAPGSDPALRAHLRALIEAPAEQPVGLAALPYILERVHSEVYAVLANLRESRAAIESATVENLQHTSARLQEVTSATEVAATDILDALDRTQNMVDDLEAAEAADDRAKSASVRDLMREELFGMMGALQFQDITTQQLAAAASVLGDMESRLLQIARLFDPAAAAPGGRAAEVPDPRTFDPNATTRDAEGRQAVADQVFVVGRPAA
jgi:chemotaxis regulatin CheY-phosphate phosphatase CheZ